MAVGIASSIAFFPLRVLVFAVGFADYYFETAADWLVGARDRTEYVREGGCVRCGRCCYLLGIEMPAWVAKRDWLVRLFAAWHSAALNFEFQGRADNMLAYRCRYYRAGPARLASRARASAGDARVAGGCSVYRFRHRLCRFFPRRRLYGHMPLHDECGFRFVRREVKKRRMDMARAGKADFSTVLSERSGGPPPAGPAPT